MSRPPARSTLLVWDESEWQHALYRDGVITSRGGDPVDWFRFVVLGYACDGGAVAQITSKWKPARPGMGLELALYDETMHPVALELHQRRKGSPSKAPTRITAVAHDLSRGTYYLAVSARHAGDAATYLIDVEVEDVAANWQSCYRTDDEDDATEE